MPATARSGEIIAIKTKIRHAMETGWRKDGEGKAVAQDRINRFVCSFEGREVFAADFNSGVSSDPYLVFHDRVGGAGTYNFRWEADGGRVFTASKAIAIVADA